MKKNYSQLICSILLILGLALTNTSRAQLAITSNSPSQCYSGSNQVICSVSSTVVGTTSYSWAYANYPCGAAPVISGTSPTVALNLPCAGNYSIGCYALNSSNAVIGVNFTSVLVTATSPPSITVTGASSLCIGNTTTLTAFGGSTYTWNNGVWGSSTVVTPSASTCYSVIGTNSSGCSAMAVHCISVTPQAITVSPLSASVCEGSSVTFTASGASTYTWNTSSPTIGSTVNVIPTTYYSVFSVTGISANGCFGTYSVFVTMDTTCADVWPGDANSDGIVNNSDVFEIGLSFNSTGTARTGGNNAYTSQFANTWTGNGSTGKNKCHIDCNGDGTVNLGDTVAIYNNFSLSHSFKPLEISTANGDIHLASSNGVAVIGSWNKVDIMLGTNTNPINQVYGVAFDINFDNTLIQPNAAYVVYSSSFLNANNQNVQFRKPDYNAGKVYAASVRVDGVNVSGFGKIGEFWFQVKNSVAENTNFNLSVSNPSRVDKNGIASALTGGSSTLTTSSVFDPNGIKDQSSIKQTAYFFPNPATQHITLQSESKANTGYSMYDIAGRELMKGEFTQSKTIDLSHFATGSYVIRFENNSIVSYQKLVLEK